MGEYTELVIKCRIIPTKKESAVNKILNKLFNDDGDFIDDIDVQGQDHPFFKCTRRWRMVGQMSSFYHVPFSCSRYERGYLFSRFDLKNYSGEIELFLDWIAPSIQTYSEKTFIGWKWYNGDDMPILIFVDNKQIYYEEWIGKRITKLIT